MIQGHEVSQCYKVSGVNLGQRIAWMILAWRWEGAFSIGVYGLVYEKGSPR